MKRKSEFDYSKEAKVLLFDTECFRGNVEILTEEGFIRFDQLGDEKVAQYHEDGSIDFVKPLRKIEKQYNGDGIEFSTRKGSIVTTANHTMVSRIPTSKKIVKTLAKDFAKGRGHILMCSGVNKAARRFSPEDKLAVALQADGCLRHTGRIKRGWGKGELWNQWEVHLRKERKIQRLIELLKETKWHWRSYVAKDGTWFFTIYTPSEITKRFDTWFKVSECGEDFLQEIALWDGHLQQLKETYRIKYATCDFFNASFVQAVAVCNGRRCSSQKRQPSLKHRFCYALDIGFMSNICERNLARKEILLDENVYCVEVQSHMIIVKGGQQVLVTGNCSPTLSWNYGQYESRAVKVEKPPVLLSVAWKWLGDTKTECLTIADNPLEDRFDCSLVVDKLWHLLDEANIVVAHNINFDIKLATAFFLRQGMTPPSPYKTFCTLQAARRYFRTDNNKLDYLGELLGVGRKEKVTNADVWYDVLFGDGQLRKKQNQLLRKYNIQDNSVLIRNVSLKNDHNCMKKQLMETPTNVFEGRLDFIDFLKDVLFRSLAKQNVFKLSHL